MNAEDEFPAILASRCLYPALMNLASCNPTSVCRDKRSVVGLSQFWSELGLQVPSKDFRTTELAQLHKQVSLPMVALMRCKGIVCRVSDV